MSPHLRSAGRPSYRSSLRRCWGRQPTAAKFLAICLVFYLWYDFANRRVDLLLDTKTPSDATGLEVKAGDKVRSSTTRNPHTIKLSHSKLEEKYSQYNYRGPEPRLHPIPHPECGTPPDFNQYFKQPLLFRSSRNEDLTIFNRLFQQDYSSPQNTTANKYVYVELGAFNGRRESNTRFFDLCLGWDGLLIEANPLKFFKLLQFRPHAHCLEYAPSCESPSRVRFHSVAFTNAAQAAVPSVYDNTSLVEVFCDRLTPALVDILDGYVTLFSLDVEGAEHLVLRTVDFDQVHVDIWMVENVSQFCLRNETCRSRDESRAILQRAGYVGFETVISGSDVFVLRGSRYEQLLQQSSDKIIPPAYPRNSLDSG